MDVIEVEHVEIPMKDGCRLSAKMWFPKDYQTQKYPTILEYIPYRKNDHTAERDAKIHRYFARNGYVCMRVDLRGSGESEGVLRDEYLEQELQDGLQILDWICDQPWSSQSVGMMGLSWGGFNSLQIAARMPECLKAIITVSSSDVRYSDDVHYMGGCLLTDNLSWASTMFGHTSCPPDPQVVGDKWKKMWMERLEGSGLWLKNWLEHQRHDEFWEHGSVGFKYEAIKCPVYAVSGWADGYTNTVFRLMKNLDVPRKGLIGPWGHKYPHDGIPGMGIGFLGDCLRWWDQWLKGKDRGADKDPRLQVWMQDSYSPWSLRRPGKWVAVDWPTSTVSEKSYHMDHEGHLGEGPDPENKTMRIQSPLSVGLFGGKWCSYHADTDLPSDQRKEDGGSLVFETGPLEEDVEILGQPVIDLELSVDQPLAMVAVRLADIGAQTGRATRVTYGILNLAHRDGHDKPKPLEPGKKYQIQCPLNYVSQRFPKGNRIRVSVSTSYWPLAWPSPKPPRMTLYPNKSKMTLPIFKFDKGSVHEPINFSHPESAPPIESTLIEPPKREWNVIHNLATDEEILSVDNNDARKKLHHNDMEIHRTVKEKFSFSNNDYRTVRAEVETHRFFKRDSWEVHTITRTVLTSSEENFRILATLDAYENEARVYSKSWDEKIPRDHV